MSDVLDNLISLKNKIDEKITKGNFEQAENLIEVFYNNVKNEIENTHNASFLFDVGKRFMGLKRYSNAKKTLETAFKIYPQKDMEDKHPDEAINDLGEAYYFCRDYRKAEECFSKALQIRRKFFGEDLLTAAYLNNLAQSRLYKNDYSTGIKYLEQALEIRRNLNGSPDAIAQSLNNLANIYHAIYDSSKAKKYHKKALQMYQKVTDVESEIAVVLNNLGYDYRDGRDYVRAEECFYQALEINLKKYSWVNPSVALNLSNLGKLYLEIEANDEAEIFIKEGLEIEKVTKTVDPDSQIRLCEIYIQKGRYQEAEKILEGVLDTLQIDKNWDLSEQADCLRTLSLLYFYWEKPQMCVKKIERAIHIEDEIISDIFSISTEKQRLEYLKRFAKSTDILLSVVLRYFPNNKKMITKTLDLAIKRKGIVMDVSMNQKEIVSKDTTLNQKFECLNELKSKLAETILNQPNVRGYSNILIDEIRKQIESSEIELAKSIPEIEIKKVLNSVDYKKLIQALPEQSTLVGFMQFKKISHVNTEMSIAKNHYVVFIISKTGTVNIVDLGSARKINRQIWTYRKILVDEYHNQDHLHKSGVYLRKIIFDPLINSFKGINRILIVPDGEICLIPFEVLPVDKKNYLIDKYEISYLSVGRDLLRLQLAPKTISEKPLVLADPNYDLESEIVTKYVQPATSRQSRDLDITKIQFDPLIETREEGREIANILNVKPWLGDDVLEGKLKAAKSPLIVHIATHGFFLKNQEIIKGNNMSRESFSLIRENPLLRAGLALAGANKRNQTTMSSEIEDGILNAMDVAELDLSATEMVVLSACDTGRGDAQIGEGVFGLRRAFVLAGAKTLVLSLWKVPDKETKETMIEFYNQLCSGESRNTALRKAVLKTKETNPDPLYWGAFICQGKTDPISNIQF